MSGCFPHSKQFSKSLWPPAGCPAVQFGSDTIPGVSVRSHKLWTQSCKSALWVVVIELAGAAHRTQESSYILDCWFIIKGYISRTARWKRCQGQGERERAQAHRPPVPSPSLPPSQHLCVFTNPEALWTPPFWVFMETSLHTQQRPVESKAMVFPVAFFIYGCESWTIKKAEHWTTDAFELWCWRRLLRVPWTARRSNQPVLKEINPGYSLERLKLKHQDFGQQMQRTDSLKKILILGKIEGKRKRAQQRMRWLDSITESVDMTLSELWGKPPSVTGAVTLFVTCLSCAWASASADGVPALLTCVLEVHTRYCRMCRQRYCVVQSRSGNMPHLLMEELQWVKKSELGELPVGRYY